MPSGYCFPVGEFVAVGAKDEVVPSAESSPTETVCLTICGPFFPEYEKHAHQRAAGDKYQRRLEKVYSLALCWRCCSIDLADDCPQEETVGCSTTGKGPTPSPSPRGRRNPFSRTWENAIDSNGRTSPHQAADGNRPDFLQAQGPPAPCSLLRPQPSRSAQPEPEMRRTPNTFGVGGREILKQKHSKPPYPTEYAGELGNELLARVCPQTNYPLFRSVSKSAAETGGSCG